MYIINYDNGQDYEDHDNNIVGWAASLEDAAIYYASMSYHRDRFMQIRRCVPNTNDVVSCGYLDGAGYRAVSPNEF